MRLVGNSVAVPVVKMLAKHVVSTGVFDDNDWDGKIPSREQIVTGQIQEKVEPLQLTIDFDYGASII